MTTTSLDKAKAAAAASTPTAATTVAPAVEAGAATSSAAAPPSLLTRAPSEQPVLKGWGELPRQATKFDASGKPTDVAAPTTPVASGTLAPARPQNETVLACIQRIVRDKGLVGLYKGFQSALVGTTASQLVFFYLYAWLKTLHKERSTLGAKYVLGPVENMVRTLTPHLKLPSIGAPADGCWRKRPSLLLLPVLIVVCLFLFVFLSRSSIPAYCLCSGGYQCCGHQPHLGGQCAIDRRAETRCPGRPTLFGHV
jgi:hypothetical protein